MPRQRIHHRRSTYDFLHDFPQRLERLQEESGLPWAEVARRLGTLPHTLWRWRKGSVRPNMQHAMALMELADNLGLGHVFAGQPRQPH